MKRFALLGVAVFGLAAGIAACGDSPVQPGQTAAAFEPTSSDARKPSGAKPSYASCESLVYPASLCYPDNRPALCDALRDAGEFAHPVVGRPATEVFTRTEPPFPSGSLEVVTMERPYGLPPTVLKFWILDADIARLCPATI